MLSNRSTKLGSILLKLYLPSIIWEASEPKSNPAKYIFDFCITKILINLKYFFSFLPKNLKRISIGDEFWSCDPFTLILKSSSVSTDAKSSSLF